MEQCVKLITIFGAINGLSFNKFSPIIFKRVIVNSKGIVSSRQTDRHVFNGLFPAQSG